MGAYLSEPITKKEIDVDEDENFWVSSASMQGWRVSQEDAHNAILEFDDFSSLFAVYDGHGGHEVAVYTAKRLPNFIKSRKNYRLGNIEEGLIEAFVEFDRSLIERDVIRELRVIAGKEADTQEQVDPEEVDSMLKEACMPIEDVIKSEKTPDFPITGTGSSSATSGGAPASAVTRFKTRNGGQHKPISPFLRAKGSNGEQQQDLKQEKLSFEDNEQQKPVENEDLKDLKDQKVINGSIEKESTNGHDTNADKNDENKVENGHEVNGETVEKSAEVKGKGKGKGKGKSSQIIKEKSSNETEPPEEPEPEPEKPKSKPKSAKELYDNLVNDEVMDEESEDDEDGDAAFAEVESSDDDDEDNDEEADSDATPPVSSEEEEDSVDEEEDDSEEYIGGDFNEEPGNDSGCTAVVGLLVGRDLYVANAGDSRCIVCRDGKAIEMSFDHKPEDEPERARINKAGGKVTQDGRVNGGLNLSRAIGDHAYKTNKSLSLQEQMISPVPDVKKLSLNPDTDTYVFLACDGIWNSLNSQEVVDFINQKMKSTESDTKTDETRKLTKIIEELFDHCLATDTMGDGTGCDNMTAVIAKLKPGAFKDHKNSVKTEAANNEAKRPATEDSESNAPEAKKSKTETSEVESKSD